MSRSVLRIVQPTVEFIRGRIKASGSANPWPIAAWQARSRVLKSPCVASYRPSAIRRSSARRASGDHWPSARCSLKTPASATWLGTGRRDGRKYPSGQASLEWAGTGYGMCLEENGPGGKGRASSPVRRFPLALALPARSGCPVRHLATSGLGPGPVGLARPWALRSGCLGPGPVWLPPGAVSSEGRSDRRPKSTAYCTLLYFSAFR